MKLKRRHLLTLGLVGVGVVALYTVSRRPKPTRKRGAPKPTPVPGGGWADEDAPRRIREIAGPLADAIGWPDLPDLLVAIAWTESRGDRQAQAGTSANAARGWFGLRPTSSRHEDAGLGVGALKEERPSVALITWYLNRMRPYADPDQVVDLLALRRGMAYPFLVADVDETMSTPRDGPGVRSKAVRKRFAEGIAKAGLPEAFMFNSAFVPGYSWPGIESALTTVGAGEVS